MLKCKKKLFFKDSIFSLFWKTVGFLSSGLKLLYEYIIGWFCSEQHSNTKHKQCWNKFTTHQRCITSQALKCRGSLPVLSVQQETQAVSSHLKMERSVICWMIQSFKIKLISFPSAFCFVCKNEDLQWLLRHSGPLVNKKSYYSHHSVVLTHKEIHRYTLSQA